MTDVDGNISVIIQKKTTEKNSIGEPVEVWSDVGSVKGWIDYSPSVDASRISEYKTKMQDTTHVLICDYEEWIRNVSSDVTSDNCRLIHDGNIYNVLLIDDPMFLHYHLEIYLKFVGGGLGCQ